ncbi:MAG TPA: YkgJ family cysteine cluster protein [Candidatus Limnocylindrales bacterium]|nr:YkgJ family cysteine cluster protein [Candidatus Limnocylindrales bacterium]
MSTKPAPAAGTTNLHFECTQCGKCCWTRGEYAHVYVNRDEMETLASALGVGVRDFRDRYTVRDADGWTELDFPGGRCVFLDPDTKLCTVYESRPTQCRTFPVWPELIRRGRWTAEARSICEGVGQGPAFSVAEVQARIAAQKLADEAD